jgi:succinate dehydrogenase / fumarate reductase flavoprotein subunit
MQRLVGIIRVAEELSESLSELRELKERAGRLSVEGNRQYNPGWHLAIDLANMLLVSECIATAALERQESRGGHTRNDFPLPDPVWGAKNLVLTLDSDAAVDLKHQPLPVMPDELKTLFEEQK